MAFEAAKAAGLSSRRWSETIVVALAAIMVSLAAAAWITSSDDTAFASAPLPEATDQLTFEDRFLGPTQGGTTALQPLDHRALSFMEMKVRNAKAMLAERLLSR